MRKQFKKLGIEKEPIAVKYQHPGLEKYRELWVFPAKRSLLMSLRPFAPGCAVCRLADEVSGARKPKSSKKSSSSSSSKPPSRSASDLAANLASTPKAQAPTTADLARAFLGTPPVPPSPLQAKAKEGSTESASMTPIPVAASPLPGSPTRLQPAAPTVASSSAENTPRTSAQPSPVPPSGIAVAASGEAAADSPKKAKSSKKSKKGAKDGKAEKKSKKSKKKKKKASSSEASGSSEEEDEDSDDSLGIAPSTSAIWSRVASSTGGTSTAAPSSG